jgi:proline iminopeptidase
MFANVNDVDLWYTALGTGKPCLVLSAAGIPIYERRTPAKLAQRLQFVFVELRGTGRSGGNIANLTFDTMSDDLDVLRDHLGLGRGLVWGHSIHGVLAVEYVRRRSASVSHAVAIGTPPRFADMGSFYATLGRFWTEDASVDRKAILKANRASLDLEVVQTAMTSGESFIASYVANGPMYWYDPKFDAAPLWADNVVRPEGLCTSSGRSLPDGTSNAWTPLASRCSLR